MEGFAINLGDLIRSATGEKSEERAQQSRPMHEAQIMELRHLLTRELRPNPFKVGDLVTPRKAGRYVGEGEPFVVIEVLPEPVRIQMYEQNDASSPDCMAPYDLRVGGLSQGGQYCVWMQRSQELEAYSGDGTTPANIVAA